MAISNGKLDSLLNETFSVDTSYFGANFVSGTTSGTGTNPSLTSLTVALNGQPGPGTADGLGEAIRIVSVDDTNNEIGYSLVINGQPSGVTLSDFVVGFNANSNALLLCALFGGNLIAEGLQGGVTSSAFNNVLSIISPTPISSGTVITFPALSSTPSPTPTPTPTPVPTPTPTPSPSGLIGTLSANQQLELIYVGYFNRAADGPGFTFWVGQNTEAQLGGQSASTALTNIANSFTPQSETVALYPFLATAGANLTTPAAQAGLNTFIGNVYQNLFAHAADPAGASYWVGQITSGAVGLGAAILAIANGATGTDATELQNKITVALDFTTRTNAARLTGTGSSSSAFLAAAHNVLVGVDGTSLNDASVTAGENATTAYISGATAGGAAARSSTVDTGSSASASGSITISVPNSVIDPGAGSHTIQFLAGASADTVVLHSGGMDQISGFGLGSGDALDVRSLFAEVGLNSQDVLPGLGSYLTIVDQGMDAALLFDPTGHGGGSAVAVLQNLGSVVTNLGVLTSHGAIQT